MKKVFICVLLLCFCGFVQAFDVAGGEGFEFYSLESWADDADPYIPSDYSGRSAQMKIIYADPQLPGGVVADPNSGVNGLMLDFACRPVTSTINQSIIKFAIDDITGLKGQSWLGATEFSFMYKGDASNDPLSLTVWIDAEDGTRSKLEDPTYKSYVFDGEWHKMSFSLAKASDAILSNVAVITFKTRSTVVYGGGPVIFDDFNVDQSAASSPSPFNGETDVASDLVLSWKAGEAADTHELYVQEGSSDFTGVNPIVNSLGNETYSLTNLVGGATYYWRVDEVDSSNTTSTGQVWSFVILDPSFPYSPEPVNGAIEINAETGILTWVNPVGTTECSVYLGTDPDNLPVVSSAQTTNQYDLTNLSWSTTYYWKVVAVVDGVSKESSVWSFTTSVLKCYPSVVGDLNNDCKFNLYDLALLTPHWLECNLFPVEACDE